MFETIIVLLIQIALVVLLCYIVIWALGAIGLALPPKVIQIFWVIVVLVVILLFYRAFAPLLAHGARLF